MEKRLDKYIKQKEAQIATRKTLDIKIKDSKYNLESNEDLEGQKEFVNSEIKRIDIAIKRLNTSQVKWNGVQTVLVLFTTMIVLMYITFKIAKGWQ